MSIRLRRGTDAERSVLTLAEGELVYTTDLKEIWSGDGSTLGGNKVVDDSLLSVAVVSFSNLDARFFGELGNPDRQGWANTTTGLPDIVQDVVFGETKNVVRLNDDDSFNYVTEYELTGQDWQNIFDYGATYSGTARLDSLNGGNGFFSGCSATSANNPDPVNTGAGRYGVTFNNLGGFLRISLTDSDDEYVLDDSAVLTLPFDEWFEFEVIIPPGMGPAQIYINNVLIPLIATWNSIAAGTRVSVSSGSSSGTNRVSYHDNFGVTVYEEPNTRILSNADLSKEDVIVLVPSGRRDYTITFPSDAIPRNIGDKLTFDFQNVYGNVTIDNEDPINPLALVNGLATTVAYIPKSTNVSAINTVVGNTYVYTPVEYRDDIVNDKDLAISGRLTSGSATIADINYPEVDGTADRYTMITDGNGNLRFDAQDGSYQLVAITDKVIGFDGRLGLPTAQGWTDASSGGSSLAIGSQNVNGSNRDTVEFDNDATDGVAATYIDLSAQDWQDLYDYGGLLTIVADHSSSDSKTSDQFIEFVLRVALADSPVPAETDDREYRFTSGRDPGTQTQLEIITSDSTATFDGGTYPLIGYTERFHTYELKIPAGLGPANVFLDGADLGITTSMVTSAESNSRMYTGSPDISLTSRSYVSEQGLEIFSDNDVTFLIDRSMIDYKNLLIATPAKSKNYTFILADDLANARPGASILLAAKNVGGTVTGRAENLSDPLITFNGESSVTIEIEDESSISTFINVSSDGVTSDYRNNPDTLSKLADVSLTDLTAGDLIEYNGTEWVNKLKTVTFEFPNANERFFGEFGLPSVQGWAEEVTGVSTVNLVQDNVFGESKQVVQAFDDGSGIATIIKTLTAEDFQNAFDFGASYSGTARLDTTDGADGFFCSLGVKSGDSPLGDGTDRRYGLTWSQSGGFVAVRFIDTIGGNTPDLVCDGVDQAVTVNADEWFDYEVVVPPGLGSADVYVNGVLLTLQAPFGGTGGGDDRTSALISTGSNSGDNRISYHDNYGVTIYKDASTKLLTNEELKSSIINVVVPSGKRDYTLTFASDANGRPVGSVIDLTAQNINGTFTFANEDALAPKALVNGLANFSFNVTKSERYSFLNVSDDSNVYLSNDVTSSGILSGFSLDRESGRVLDVPVRSVKNVTEAPVDPAMGEQYFDTDEGKPFWWDGTVWVDGKGNNK